MIPAAVPAYELWRVGIARPRPKATSGRNMRVFAKIGERLVISNIHVEVDKATSISVLENYFPIPSPSHRLSQADAMILVPRPLFLFQVMYTQFSKLLTSISIISLRNYQYIQ